MALLNVCVATANDNARSEVLSIASTSSRRGHSNPSSPVLPDNSLDPSQRPAGSVDDYVATDVYCEIADNVYESVAAADDRADNDDYDVLGAQSVQPSQAALTTTVPVYISLLSDADAE